MLSIVDDWAFAPIAEDRAEDLACDRLVLHFTGASYVVVLFPGRCHLRQGCAIAQIAKVGRGSNGLEKDTSSTILGVFGLVVGYSHGLAHTIFAAYR